MHTLQNCCWTSITPQKNTTTHTSLCWCILSSRSSNNNDNDMSFLCSTAQRFTVSNRKCPTFVHSTTKQVMAQPIWNIKQTATYQNYAQKLLNVVSRSARPWATIMHGQTSKIKQISNNCVSKLYAKVVERSQQECPALSHYHAWTWGK